MDLKTNREVIPLRETLYSGVQEQSVELDYVLPDYYPEIFRILQSRAEPRILSWQISGTVLSYELCVTLEILYCGEGTSPAVHCLRQRLTYQKTLDLGRGAQQIWAELCPKPDYINCRAVNPRRIDLRGAVSVKITATGTGSCEAVCDVFGRYAQTRKQPVEFAAKTLRSAHTLTISEEATLGEAKPAVRAILRADAVLMPGETKLIAGKLAAKGEVRISLLYACADGMEPMQLTLPYSKILDVEGLDEGFTCLVQGEVVACDVTAAANNDGEARALQCELTVRLCCTAVKAARTSLVTDVYSTRHPETAERTELSLPQVPVAVCEPVSVEAVLQAGTALGRVCDAWCVLRNLGTRLCESGDAAEVSGMLRFCVMAHAEDGTPVLLEQEQPFSHTLSVPAGTAALSLSGTLTSCAYHLTGADAATVKAELRLDGWLETAAALRAVTGVEIDDETALQREDDCALKLYYGAEGEALWDIAKKYRTAVTAIAEENDLTGEQLAQGGMLLIPLVG